jgi:hypothetical protein
VKLDTLQTANVERRKWSVISREELQQYVNERDAAGTSNEVQRRYDDLVRALRHG